MKEALLLDLIVRFVLNSSVLFFYFFSHVSRCDVKVLFRACDVYSASLRQTCSNPYKLQREKKIPANMLQSMLMLLKTLKP